MSEMIDTDDVGLFLNRAIRVQNLLTGMKKADLKQLANAVQDIAKSVASFDYVVENNVLLKAMRSIYGVDPNTTPKADDGNASFIAALSFLKSKGVDDPDIDLFLAVDSNDGAGLKAAIDRGGNVNVTTGELLARYEAQLKTYN